MKWIRFAGGAFAFAALAWGTAPDAAPSPAATLSAGGVAPRRDGDRTTPLGTPQAVARSLPLFFEENRGQAPEGWDFLVRCRGYHAFVRSDGICFSFDGAALRLSIDGGPGGARDVPPDVSGLTMDARANYFLGNDATRWIRGIPLTRGVRYAEVARGTSWTAGGQGRALEFTFDVKGTEPTFSLDGALSLGVDAEGRLLAAMPRGRATFSAPVAWQDLPEGRRDVGARFVVAEEGRVRVALGAHDASRPVHVDPTVSYQSYLGKDGQDAWVATAMDSGGSPFLAGSTGSSDFPVTSGAYDTSHAGSDISQVLDFFVLKLGSSGDSIAWATFLGGRRDENCLALAVDSAGRPVIGGASYGTDFPTTPGVVRSSVPTTGRVGVLSKLSADGSNLVWSTYVQASGCDAVAFGPNDEVHFTDGSSAYRLSADAQTLEYTAAVYHPVTMYAQSTLAQCIAVDADGNAYVGGTTSQENLVMTEGTIQTEIAGQHDGLLVKIDSDGAVVWRTLLGGSKMDAIRSIGLDAQGRPYVAGETWSSDFPVTAGAYQSTFRGALGDGGDAFVACVATDASKLRYSTFLGGSGADAAWGLGVHPSGVVWVAGQTYSANFPAEAPSQSTYGGSGDAFVSKLDGFGQVVWSTWVGGSSVDHAGDLACAADGTIVVAGGTESTDLPTESALQTTKEDSDELFFLSVPDTLSATADLPEITTAELPSSTIGAAYTTTIADSGGAAPIAWTHVSGALPPGTSFDAGTATVSGTLTRVGTYSMKFRVEDALEFYGEREVPMVVNAAPTFVTPFVLPACTRDRPYDLALEMTDGTGPFTFTRTSGNLPAGILLGSDGRLAGTPSAVGNNTFTVRATDSAGIHADRTFGLRINTPPTVFDSRPPASTETVPYSHDLGVSNGTAPFTWAVVAGSLPILEEIDPAGRIVGTARSSGTWDFTVRATDASGATSERAFSVLVHPFPQIVTTDLPPAAVGRPYRRSLAASGGMPPLVWGAASGSLPAGLDVGRADGVISGVPTAEGTFDAELACADAASAVARRTLAVRSSLGVDLTKSRSSEKLALDETSAPHVLRYLELLRGTLLDVSVKGGVAEGVGPSVTLTAADGTPLDLLPSTKASRKGVQVRRFPVPATGRYFLTVSQAPGAVGKMSISTSIVPPGGADAVLAASADALETAFSAPPGARVTVTVKAAKKSTALPRIVSLLDGDDADLLAGGTVKEKGKTATFRSTVPLGGGDYRVLTAARDGTSGDVVVSVRLKLPKTFDFALPDLPAGDAE